MRAVKLAAIIMGILIVVGTMTLIILVVRRSAAPSVTSPPANVSAILQQPAGTRIVGIAAVQDRLAVRLEGGGPDRIVILDPHTGTMTGQIGLAQ